MGNNEGTFLTRVYRRSPLLSLAHFW